MENLHIPSNMNVSILHLYLFCLFVCVCVLLCLCDVGEVSCYDTWVEVGRQLCGVSSTLLWLPGVRLVHFYPLSYPTGLDFCLLRRDLIM